MKYAVEMGLGTMIYISSFIKTGSGIQKLLGGLHIQTHRQQGDIINLLNETKCTVLANKLFPSAFSSFTNVLCGDSRNDDSRICTSVQKYACQP
jgi:hypothetical protein